MYRYNRSMLISFWHETNTHEAPYERQYWRKCFYIKSRFFSSMAALSPWSRRSTFEHTTIIGIPRLTLRTPSPRGNSSFKFSKLSSSSSSLFSYKFSSSSSCLAFLSTIYYYYFFSAAALAKAAPSLPGST